MLSISAQLSTQREEEIVFFSESNKNGHSLGTQIEADLKDMLQCSYGFKSFLDSELNNKQINK